MDDSTPKSYRTSHSHAYPLRSFCRSCDYCSYPLQTDSTTKVSRTHSQIEYRPRSSPLLGIIARTCAVEKVEHVTLVVPLTTSGDLLSTLSTLGPTYMSRLIILLVQRLRQVIDSLCARSAGYPQSYANTYHPSIRPLRYPDHHCAPR